MKVLIDNGHGDNTPGKRSPDGSLLEYKWARQMAARLKEALKAQGIDVALVTPEVTDVSITERVRRVNKVCNELGSASVLLVSIHVNAASNGIDWAGARGWSVYVSKNASAKSKRCAAILTGIAKEREMTGNRAVPARGYWQWDWTDSDIALLRNTKCPAILTENFFMDNKEDAAYLLSEEGKAQICALHADGIINYIKEFEL